MTQVFNVITRIIENIDLSEVYCVTNSKTQIVAKSYLQITIMFVDTNLNWKANKKTKSKLVAICVLHLVCIKK